MCRAVEFKHTVSGTNHPQRFEHRVHEWSHPSRALEHQQALWPQVPRRCRKYRTDVGRVVGRVEQDQVEHLAEWTPQGRRERGSQDGALLGQLALRDVTADQRDRPRVPIDEDDLGGAPAQGFDPHRAGTSAAIEHSSPGDPGGQDVEECLTKPI